MTLSRLLILLHYRNDRYSVWPKRALPSAPRRLRFARAAESTLGRLARLRLESRLRRASTRPLFAPTLTPPFWGEVGQLTDRLGFLNESRGYLPAEQGAQGGAERDLNHRPGRGAGLSQDVPDRPFGVEQGTERTAGEDAVEEAEATGTERAELGGSAPAHLLRVIGRNGLIALRDLRRPPGAHAGKEGGQSRVHPRIRTHQKARLVPPRLHLEAFVRASPRLRHSLPEPLRTRRAKGNSEAALHQATVTHRGSP